MTFDGDYITLLEGDVTSVVPRLEAGSVHMIATSPPFYGLRAYAGVSETDWPAVTYAPMPGLAPITVPAMRCCLGLEPTLEAYVAHLVHVWRLLWRVLRDDGTCFLNLGDSYANDGKWGGSTGGKHVEDLHGRGAIGRTKQATGLKPKDLCMVPHRVALALQADGWYVRSAIVWAKGISFCEHYAGSCMPERVTDRPTSAYELVFLLSKEARYFYDHEAVKEKAMKGAAGSSFSNGKTAVHQLGRAQNGERVASTTRNLRNVWTISPEGFPGSHFAVWPRRLVAPMIRAGTSEHGTCSACGAPFERVVERQSNYEQREPAHAPYSEPSKVDSTGWRPPTITEHGWQPTCTCEAGVVPAVVLDPFAGSATTCVAARALGRRSVGIDQHFDPDVLRHRRLAQTTLL